MRPKKSIEYFQSLHSRILQSMAKKQAKIPYFIEGDDFFINYECLRSVWTQRSSIKSACESFNTDFHSRYNRQSSTQIKRSRLSPRFYRKAMGLETIFVVFQLLSELGYELSF